MAKDMFWTTVTFAAIIIVLMLAFWPTNKGYVTVKFDCSIVEWNSDAPTFVKEECMKRKQK